MRAVARDERATLILNVRNRGTLSVLDADAVIEVPCLVDANGAHPMAVDPLPDHATGLVRAVKGVERDVLAAAGTGSRAAAVRAFALHPRRLGRRRPPPRRRLPGGAPGTGLPQVSPTGADDAGAAALSAGAGAGAAAAAGAGAGAGVVAAGRSARWCGKVTGRSGRGPDTTA